MSNEMFTQLPTVTAATLADVICAIQGGVSVQESLSQIVALGIAQTILYYAGNPNGNVAGTTYQFCWDTADESLWICTTSGASTSAVWTNIFGNLSNGQIFIGSSGGIPIANTLTAGANITITNASGAITIASTGSATGFSWTTVTTSTQAMATNNGYFANNASGVTFTLPTTAAVGDPLKIIGRGAGGWILNQNAGQQIIVGNEFTTAGTGGSLSSSNKNDSLNLVCMVANSVWISDGAPQSLGLNYV